MLRRMTGEEIDIWINVYVFLSHLCRSYFFKYRFVKQSTLFDFSHGYLSKQYTISCWCVAIQGYLGHILSTLMASTPQTAVRHLNDIVKWQSSSSLLVVLLQCQGESSFQVI